jgi:hypothetical protein
MQRRIMIGLTCLTMIAAFAISAAAVEVVQGKCVQYDNTTKKLVIEEYDLNFGPDHKYGRPTGKQSTYDLREAVIGATPEPGDIVRIAYNIKGTERLATKVMNVTKQDIMSK